MASSALKFCWRSGLRPRRFPVPFEGPVHCFNSPSSRSPVVINAFTGLGEEELIRRQRVSGDTWRRRDEPPRAPIRTSMLDFSSLPTALSPPSKLAPASVRLLLRTYQGASARVHPSPPSPPPDPRRPPVVTYHGAFSSTLRSVKVLSISTCVLSLTLGPVVTFYTLPAVNVFAKASMAALMMLLSASTTAGLHWFSSPYVHKLEWRRGSSEADAELLSWLGTKVRRKISLAAVRPADTQRPLVSFAANGQYYYIEEEALEDTELLERLTPK